MSGLSISILLVDPTCHPLSPSSSPYRMRHLRPAAPPPGHRPTPRRRPCGSAPRCPRPAALRPAADPRRPARPLRPRAPPAREEGAREGPPVGAIPSGGSSPTMPSGVGLLQADFGPSFLSLPIQKQVRESVGAALRLHKIQSNPPAVCQFDGNRWGNHVQEEEGQSQKANQDAELAGPA